jgi:hypothetical protein
MAAAVLPLKLSPTGIVVLTCLSPLVLEIGLRVLEKRPISVPI